MEAFTVSPPSAAETVSILGVLLVLVARDRGNGMRWRVFLELTGADGAVRRQDVAVGGSPAGDLSVETIGLTLAEGKSVLAGSDGPSPG